MSKFIKVDFHTHTRYSPDSLSKEELLIKTARERGLGKVAVTDHNSIQGALKAFSLAPELVIVGEEIMTTSGEILAYYVQEEVPRGLSALETIERLRAQNAVISIPHPFDPFRSDWTREELVEIAPLVDAVETFNARCFTNKMNRVAQVFALEHGLAGTAGSDGHWHREVGGAYLELPAFHDADSLRLVLKEGKTGGKRTSPLIRFYSIYVQIKKMTAAG